MTLLGGAQEGRAPAGDLQEAGGEKEKKPASPQLELGLQVTE